MNSRTALALLIAALAYTVAQAHETPSDRFFVSFPDTERIKVLLHSHDLDVTGVDHRKKQIEALVTQKELDLLIEAKADLAFSVPQSVLRGPDPEYMNPQKIEARLIEYAQSYPQLVQLKKIGESLEKRPIWAVKISDNVGTHEKDEPTVFYNSMHHAREIMTPEVSMDIIDYLVTRYNSDEKVRRWVDETEVWVVPMFNVDGNNYVWTKDSMWRKNMRGGHGVDLNRNYPTNWNACNGSSGSTWSQTYRGPAAASEPETLVMMNFVKEIRPVFSISYHAYSEMVLYPYGCRPHRAQTAEVVEGIGREMGRLLNYSTGTPWELLYNADGGDIDWLYQEMQVIPYVIEVNSSRHGGFHPDYAQWRDVTVEKNRVGWQLLLDRALASGVRGVTEASEIEVKDSKGKSIQTYRVNPDGTYHLVLLVGDYELVYRQSARVLDTRAVKIQKDLIKM
ncbi:MAG: M14 family metallopeptidase [Bacteriovoracia bacterium]